MLICIILLSGIAISCAKDPPTAQEKYLPFHERLATSQDFKDFGIAGHQPDLTDIEFVVAGDRAIAKLAIPDYGFAVFAFEGDTLSATEFHGFGIKTMPEDNETVALYVESPDQAHSLRLAYLPDIGLAESRIISPDNMQAYGFDWNQFFQCVELRADSFPGWVDATCGISLFLCVFGNPLGCLATAGCAVAYIAPCFLEQW
ncbi:MAG: hypothetical protein V1853_00860 [bacterium]